MDFAGYREYQAVGQLITEDSPQPKLTRNGAPMNRTYVSAAIRNLCADARVPEEKGNPQCLKRLYQATRGVIENNVALLVEQAMDRLLEQEQLEVGWEEN